MKLNPPQFLHHTLHWQQWLHHPRLPDASAVLLGLVAVYSAAQLSWQVLGLALPTEQPLKQAPVAVQGGRNLASQIADLALFGGRSEPTTPYGSTSMMDAPDTQLNLRLLGTIASPNPNIARAIISANGGPDAYYAIGATLAGGAIIRAIFEDRVILEYNGRYEALRLPKQVLAVITPDRSVPAQHPTTTDPEVNVITPQYSSAELNNLRGKLMSDPGSFVGKLNYRAVKENGIIKGYRVYPGNDVPMFNKLGLKNGDLVTSVNGIAMNDQAALYNFFGQMGGLNEIKVEIERNGQKKILKLTLNR